jgi:hypothetical protein
VLIASLSGFDPNATSSALSAVLSEQPSLVGQKHGPDHPLSDVVCAKLPAVNYDLIVEQLGRILGRQEWRLH